MDAVTLSLTYLIRYDNISVMKLYIFSQKERVQYEESIVPDFRTYDLSGSVCLRIEDKLFSGDTLFEGSCGRTDLPGGSWSQILQSLKRLAALEGNYWVRSGHGPDSTLADEKKWNPYMRG